MAGDLSRPPQPEREPSDGDATGGDPFSRLRELLLGDERRQIGKLERQLDEWQLSSEEVAERLPEALALSGARDERLARALAPTIEAGIDESVERDPQRIAQAVYPVLGPAIRKAIAETMAGFVDSLNRAIEHSLSLRGLKWRLEAWRSGVPYSQIIIKHALVYRVEQVFLIHRETGLLLVHQQGEDTQAKDPDLVSAMLTAIRDFVSDSFDAEDEGGLENFRVGNLNVLVERGPRALIATVVRGQPPAELRRRLQETLERIHLHFHAPLNAFAGDAAPFEPARPLLDACLETVLTTDKAAGRGWVARVGWLLLAFLLVAAIAWLVHSSLRWRRVVGTLERAPGIVLIEADRSFGHWRLRGLYDADTADPQALLLESGVDPARVEANWQPYLSLDPRLVAERARRRLVPPPSVELKLDRGRLVATGSSSPRWRARAEGLAGSLPGVAEIDLSGVELLPSPELRDAQARVEELRVLFGLGSADLEAASRTVLEQLGPALRRLRESAAEQGYAVAVDIVGRTDATGSEETNRLLSRQRADAVRQALIEAGYPGGAFRASGVGISKPLPAETPQAASSLNRSASFRVELRPENG